MVPLTEHRITWKNGRGEVSRTPTLLIPGSSIKGALKHRMAFHARRLTKSWAPAQSPDAEEMPPEVEEVFGSIKDDETGEPGRVFLGDICPDGEPFVISHVSIDRFSGGPIDGALFDEAPVRGTSRFIAPLTVDVRPRNGGSRVSAIARRALRAALDDLCSGRLAIGAGGNRGHGYFRGRVRWNGIDPLEDPS